MTQWEIVKPYCTENTGLCSPRWQVGVNHSNPLEFTLHVNMAPHQLPSDGDIPFGREEAIELRDALNKMLEDTKTPDELKAIRQGK